MNSGLMIIPASMRGYEKEDEMNEGQADIGTCVMQAMPELQLQLRTHNYYMGTFDAFRRSSFSLKALCSSTF